MERFTVFDKKGFLGNSRKFQVETFEPENQKAKVQHQVAIYMLQQFVEHKGEKYISLIFEELEKFIQANGPVIEDVHQRIKIRNLTPFGKISGEFLEKSLRHEVKDAKSGLDLYTKSLGLMSDYLTRMLDPNYGAQKFLQDQYGISVENSSLFAKDLELQWAATYGLLIDRLKQIIGKVAIMRKCLMTQLHLYHKLETPSLSFISAVNDEDELQKWFKLERDSYHKLVNLTKLSTYEVGQIQNVLAAQAHHLKEMLKTHVHIVYTGVRDEIEESEDKIEKALVVFCFVLKAAIVGTSIQKTILKKTLHIGSTSVADKLESAARDSRSLLSKLTGDQKKAVRYSKQFIKILEHLPRIA